MQRSFSVFSIIAILALVLSACGGDSHEAAAAEGNEIYEEMLEILEGVTDEKSADAAVPAMEALGQRLKALGEKQSKLPEITEEEARAIAEQYGQDAQKHQSQLAQQMMKLMQYPELAAALQKAMSGGQ